MKLRKTTLLLIVLGVLVIAAAGLTLVNSQRFQERNQLDEKLALTQARLRGIRVDDLSSRVVELESKLNQTKIQYDEAKVLFPQQIGNTTAANTLFEIIRSYGLEVTGLAVSGSGSGQLEGVSLSYNLLKVKVRGGIPAILSFVSGLNSQSKTFVVESVVISREAPVAQPSQPLGLAPGFQMQNVDREGVSLSQFTGKPMLINFWITGDPFSRSEMPYLQQIYEEWAGRGLVVLAIDVGDDSLVVEDFVETNKLSLPVLLDTDTSTAQKYDVTAFPTTFFVDSEGMIQEKVVGAFPSAGAIEEHLDWIIPRSEEPSGDEASAEIEVVVYSY